MAAGIGLAAQNAVFVNSPNPASDYEVSNAAELNSPQLDFHAVPYKDGVIFTSTRDKESIFSCDQDFAKGHYSDLYFAKTDAEGNFYVPQLLEGEVNGRYHDGVATFTPEGNTMYFSRNSSAGPNDKGLIDLKVCTANWKNGMWKEVRETTFNSPDFASCHPSLSADGNWLFFASNRPGGYGGMDIYVCRRLEDGSLGAPINLGSTVNTTGNEIFPFIAADKRLYFSSNGHYGNGGLDVFSVQMEASMAEQRNLLPPPVNSGKDDFGFTSNADGTMGFFTSNRSGGMGMDDIYHWAFTGEKTVPANICVIDKNTQERFENARLTIIPASVGGNGSSPAAAMQMQQMTFDGKQYWVLVPADGQSQTGAIANVQEKSCNVKYPVKPGTNYILKAEKSGYQPIELTVSAEELLNAPEWLLPLSPRKTEPMAFKGTVRDKETNNLLPYADVKVLNKCNGEKLEMSANGEGEFQFPMDCNCDYELIAYKGDYLYEHKTLRSSEGPCDKPEPVILMYLERSPEAVKTPSVSAENLEVGTVIRLDKLYYDYNKYFIRPDAEAELDKVVAWMKKYPSLEIELGSHTDARGSDEYNEQLSQDRANEAVNYIVRQGISRSRISAAGYGEYSLDNDCGNNVPCTEAEHQWNRRTEIRVTKFEETGVRIED